MYNLSEKEVVKILMGSAFYFDLELRERHSLIRHIIEISSREPLCAQALRMVWPDLKN